jgi:HK97 gp10 family phage protein
MTTVKVEGLAELHRKLLELPARIERNVVRRAVYAGAAVIRDDMRERAPIYTGEVSEGHPPPGTLKKSIYVKYIPEKSRGGRTVYYVGVRHGKSRQHVGKKDINRDAYYFRFIEFGTEKMAAQPFMRPAFDSKQGAALGAIKDTLASGISDEVAKL